MRMTKKTDDGSGRKMKVVPRTIVKNHEIEKKATAKPYSYRCIVNHQPSARKIQEGN